jgi:hypothetical protein
VSTGAKIDPKIANLRTPSLKRDRELRTACLFCYGMSKKIEQPFKFIPKRTRIAQVFDERGEGLIVQGGSASYDKDDRSPT